MLKQTKVLFINKSMRINTFSSFRFKNMLIDQNIKYFSSKYKYKQLIQYIFEMKMILKK